MRRSRTSLFARFLAFLGFDMSSDPDKRLKDIFSEAEERLTKLRDRRRAALRRLRDAVEKKKLEKARNEIADL